MMMPLIRIEISRGIARIIRAAVMVRTVGVTSGIAPVRPIALVRSDRRGMEARQDQRQEAAKDDQRAHRHPLA